MELTILCACGCGEKVKWNYWDKKWNKYIKGHNRIGISHSDATKEKLSIIALNISNETRIRMSKAQIGKVISEETKIKQRKAMLGKKHSNATKEKISKASKNISNATRERMSKANKGRKHTDETKAKMSIAAMGRKCSNETKAKMSIAAMGRKCSNETKAKMSKVQQNRSDETRKKLSKSATGRIMSDAAIVKMVKAQTGKKHSDETKAKMSQANMGENNPNWKNGISCEPYCQIWSDKEYKESIRKRDNYICQNPDCWGNCNPNCALSLHHINYIKKDCDPWNLISLCRGCNARANKNQKKHMKFYQNIMAEKNTYNYN